MTRSAVSVALRISWMLLPVSVVGTCSGDAVDMPPQVESRDSAGVRIVESSRPAWEDSNGWSIDSIPSLDLGTSGVGDEHVFHQVRGMVRFSDGSFAVANGGSHEVRFYSPEGVFRAATGREGEGPGEFTAIKAISRAESDTLLVLDYDGRMTVLGADGAFARVVRLPGYVTSVHALGSGEALVVFGYASVSAYEGSGGMIRAPQALWRYDMGGVRGDSIGRTAGREEYMFSVDGGRGSTVPLFAKGAHVATHDKAIFIGNANAMQVEELSPSGQLLRILRLADFPLALTADAVVAERNARLGNNPDPLSRQIVDQLPDPDSRPAYAQVLVDAEAAIWLRPFLGRSERGGPESWQVLDSAGMWLGGVEVMESLRVMSVESDVVLGIWTDSLGVEHPRVHRLRRGS